MKDPTQLMIEYHTTSREEADDLLMVLDSSAGKSGAFKYTLESMIREASPYRVSPAFLGLAEWALGQVDWQEVARAAARYLEVVAEGATVTLDESADIPIYRVYVKMGDELFFWRGFRPTEFHDAPGLASITARNVLGEWLSGKQLIRVDEMEGSIVEAW